MMRFGAGVFVKASTITMPNDSSERAIAESVHTVDQSWAAGALD